jgi:hypothetical protein
VFFTFVMRSGHTHEYTVKGDATLVFRLGIISEAVGAWRERGAP